MPEVANPAGEVCEWQQTLPTGQGEITGDLEETVRGNMNGKEKGNWTDRRKTGRSQRHA